MYHPLSGKENYEAKAIRLSNEALRERCKELQEFQARNKSEKEFVLTRFREARRLVEQLRVANCELQRRAGETGPELKGPAADGQARCNGESAESSLASYTTITQSMFNCPTAPQAEEPQGQAESSEFVRLLKSRKEELEGDLQALRLENRLLQQQLAQERGADRNSEETTGQSPVRRPDPQDRLPGAGEHLDQLENRLKQQEADFEAKVQGLTRQVEQLSDDRTSLKAQVTSLLAELVESQSTVETMRKHSTVLEDKCQVLEEPPWRAQEKEAEAQKKQSSVTIDQLRIVAHNSESALKTERQNASEDKRKLAQLQAAYHQLFAEYDLTVKDGKRNRGQADDIGEQLREAEAALAMKQELIDKLKEEAETMKAELETVPVLKAQAEVFKADFLAERAAREQLHQHKELQQERIKALQVEFDKLRAEHEVAMRAHIEELQRRHSDSLRTPVGGQGNYFQNGSTVPFHVPAEPPHRHAFPDEQPDYRCPKCQYQAPDMDTLQIHVMDCIQ
ncbi:LOW QUALITY PROTEIN: NF-kappa-B essential modulator-like [Pristis pectinata]|uniref:LOW QUALITY PROTEIN: NF-kappa-B essential modulator-like n=1 Tax=Pristis pectinata TaxID=685728 RepID=UPI00223E297D|nr:LOW QUALITY PROTEIN: NF-kappa-B essential modulator-like [Pristis pectinata]